MAHAALCIGPHGHVWVHVASWGACVSRRARAQVRAAALQASGLGRGSACLAGHGLSFNSITNSAERVYGQKGLINTAHEKMWALRLC